MSNPKKIVGATQHTRVWDRKLRASYVNIFHRSPPEAVRKVITEIEKHYETTKEREVDFLQCDQCYGWSPETETECPYCADTGGEPSAEQEASLKDPEPEAQEAHVTEFDHSPHDDEEPEVEDAPRPLVENPDPEPPPADETTIQVDLSEVAAAEPEMAKPSDKPIKRKKKGKEAATAPDLPMAVVATLATEADLDESIKRFHAAAGEGADAMYLMGQELARMRDVLWNQRTDGGKPKYKSFNQFVVEELDVSKATAYRLLRVVETFSQGDFRKHGSQVLKVLVAAPAEDHARLLEKAEAGATTRELESEVKKIREEKGIKVLPSKSASPRAPKPQVVEAAMESRRREAAAITVGLRAEQTTVPLFSRITGDEDGNPDRARALDDEPYGSLEALNGTKLFFAVRQHPSGNLELLVTARRDSEDDA